jgi:glycosyltransferase involved in cell wall biosynthesis
MISWLRRASIYAFPARYEPFGLSVLEAAMSGCALVLGDIPSLRELWDGAAYFVPPADTEGLRDVIRELISSHTWRKHLGAQARRRASGYAPGIMASQYIEAYTRMASAALPSQTRSEASAQSEAIRPIGAQLVLQPGPLGKGPDAHPIQQAA